MTDNPKCLGCGSTEEPGMSFYRNKKDQPKPAASGNAIAFHQPEQELAFHMCFTCMADALGHAIALKKGSQTECEHEKSSTLIMGKSFCKKCGKYL